MLDQNTDRLWYVIGAVLIGAAVILLLNESAPRMFASIGETFESTTEKALGEIRDPNLIRNGSFNNGYAHWRRHSVFENNSAILSPEADKPDHHILHVHMNHDDRAVTPMNNNERIDAQEGERYVVSFDYKKLTDGSFNVFTVRGWPEPDTKANGTEMFDFDAFNSSSINNSQLNHGDIGEWVRYSFAGTVTDDGPMTVAPYFNRGGDEYQIRDISIEKEISENNEERE